jgi:hypothetical protein
MAKCSLLREGEGGGSRSKQDSRKALLLAGSCAVSSAFMAVLQEQVEAEARGAAEQALRERRSSGGGGLQQAWRMAWCLCMLRHCGAVMLHLCGAVQCSQPAAPAQQCVTS